MVYSKGEIGIVLRRAFDSIIEHQTNSQRLKRLHCTSDSTIEHHRVLYNKERKQTTTLEMQQQQQQ
jgi:hypothetical protein